MVSLKYKFIKYASHDWNKICFKISNTLNVIKNNNMLLGGKIILSLKPA